MISCELYSHCFGRLVLVCLSLSIPWTSVNARYFDDRFKSLSDLHHRPWSRMDHDVSLEYASSDHSPAYSRIADSKSRHTSYDSSESYEKPREWYATSSTKKVPMEDKSFKKIISPFYTITDKDSQKYKDMVMKSGVPYCQEVTKKRADKDSNAKDSLTCYKCKNPKNGATYEQCSYVSQPMTESSDVDEMILPPPGFRIRRSNSDEENSGYKNSEDYKTRDNPYRFNEKLFADGTEDVPSEYRNKNEKCEKVLRDSMVCMVCRDTKSNAKYEQCSYVRQPSEKTYAYSKSSSFKNPERNSGENEKEDAEDSVDEKRSESKPVREYSDYDKKHGEMETGDFEEEIKESRNDCKKVQKNSQTCTVCKDPKTGRNYEKCSYVYEPDDKVYKYTRSKSYGQPKASASSKEDSKHDPDKTDEKSKSESDDYTRDYSIPESFYEKYQSSPSSSYFKDGEPTYHKSASEKSKSISDRAEYSSGYDKSKSESEKIAKSIESDNCKEVQKDSMTCKVCKDPKTGSNSEQCSYNYQPKDKSYSYSKSKSFGSPTESEEKSYEGSDRKENREPKDKNYSYSKSKSFGSPTESEEKSYEGSDRKENREPKDKNYSYSKSKSFGSPTESEEKSYEGSDRKENREPSYESHGYDYPAEKRSYITDDDNSKKFSLSNDENSKDKEESASSPSKKVDASLYDAFKQKAEIQKVLQEFQKEDRSNCKKLIRNKMTCYQCVDEKGFQKEECAFVAADGLPTDGKVGTKETKGYRTEPTKKVPRSIIDEELVQDSPLEPEVAANEKVYVRKEKPEKENSEEEGKTAKEVEPYEYVAETRPVFDKILGFSLPAYMLATSEHEEEFDKIIAGSI